MYLQVLVNIRGTQEDEDYYSICDWKGLICFCFGVVQSSTPTRDRAPSARDVSSIINSIII